MYWHAFCWPIERPSSGCIQTLRPSSGAELADVSEGVARLLRDEFFPREMLLPGRIIGLNATVKDAIVLRYLQKGLSRGQIRDLVPVGSATLVERVLCVFISAECSMELVPP